MVGKAKKSGAKSSSNANSDGANQVESSKPSTVKRKPFRSISQVLDTPVTPDLLAALPTPVQQTNLMMGGGGHVDQVRSAADPQLVHAALAAFTDQAYVMIAADSQNLLDLFKALVQQLPIKITLKTALQRQGLVKELNSAAKALVEGTGRQMDIVICDPEIVKQDGQLVPLLHSQYSVPVALFSSTSEAIHTQLVDDWLNGPGNGDVNITELAALILRWHAKTNGLPEPQLTSANPNPQMPQMNGMGMVQQQFPGQMMPNAAAGGMTPAPMQPAPAAMQPQAPQAPQDMQQAPAPVQPHVMPTPGSSSAAPPVASSSSEFQPLVSSLQQEVQSLRAQLESKRNEAPNVPSDPSKIESKMFKSADGRELAYKLIKEMRELTTQKDELVVAKKKAAALAAEAKRAREEAAKAKAAEEEKQRQIALEAEKEKQEKEALERRKQAEASARARLTPTERRMNAYALVSHAVKVDEDDL